MQIKSNHFFIYISCSICVSLNPSVRHRKPIYTVEYKYFGLLCLQYGEGKRGEMLRNFVIWEKSTLRIMSLQNLTNIWHKKRVNCTFNKSSCLSCKLAVCPSNQFSEYSYFFSLFSYRIHVYKKMLKTIRLLFQLFQKQWVMLWNCLYAVLFLHLFIDGFLFVLNLYIKIVAKIQHIFYIIWCKTARKAYRDWYIYVVSGNYFETISLC